jgi:hypothetical protein
LVDLLFGFVFLCLFPFIQFVLIWLLPFSFFFYLSFILFSNLASNFFFFTFFKSPNRSLFPCYKYIELSILLPPILTSPSFHHSIPLSSHAQLP